MMSHDSISRRILVCAGISGALAVVMGSMGAHGLDTILTDRGVAPDDLPRRLEQYDVAVRYHLLHSVALLALASLSVGSPHCRRWVAWLFLLGLVLFSGSLYVLVLTDNPKLGAITPIGGLCWIVGWLLLPFMARRSEG